MALTMTAVSGLGLLFCAAGALVAFPTLNAVRFWAGSWILAALGFLQGALAPVWGPAHGILDPLVRTALVQFSTLALGLGFLNWFQIPADQREGFVARTFLWAGTFLALLSEVLGLAAQEPLAGAVPSVWALVPAVVGVVLATRKASSREARAQALRLLVATLVGPVLFVVSWIVLPPVTAGVWGLGFPPLALVGAALFLRALALDSRQYPRPSEVVPGVERGPVREIVVDVRGIVSISPRLEPLLGPGAEAVGRPLSVLGADDESRQTLEALGQLRWADWEGELVLGPGSSRVHAVCRRIHNDDRMAVGAVVLIRDEKQVRRATQGARYDPVTGLLNRWWTLELVEAELLWIDRYGGDLAGLVLDIKNLDQVEQHFGTDAAHDVLQRLGDIVARCLRKSDLCGRVGPHEFLVVMPGANGEKAAVVASRLERTFALSSDAEALGAQLRVGWGTWEPRTDSAEAFLDRLGAGASSIES